MSIKYEVQSIKNAQGSGDVRLYVRIHENPPMEKKSFFSHMQAASSLPEGGVAASLAALRDNMIHELARGNRFYIPSIGHFSLSVDLDMPGDKPASKARGEYISVRNIKFRPDASMLRTVKNGAHFERSSFTTKSNEYTEEDMLAKIKEYLATNKCINRREMERLFGLRQNTALKWLKHFTQTGALRKDGVWNSPVYFLNE